VTTDLRLNEPRYPSLPNIMKAKKKPLDRKTPAELGVDISPHLKVLKTEEPASRKAGVKVKSVAELVEKLNSPEGDGQGERGGRGVDRPGQDGADAEDGAGRGRGWRRADRNQTRTKPARCCRRSSAGRRRRLPRRWSSMTARFLWPARSTAVCRQTEAGVL
jgi:hypothetical protein